MSSTASITTLSSTSSNISTAPSPYALTWTEQNVLGYIGIGIVLICSIAYVPVLYVSYSLNEFSDVDK